MLQENHTARLLDLEGYIVESIEVDDRITIYITKERSSQCCPRCAKMTATVHDYRQQIIKDLPIQSKHVYLHLRKRRYICSCGKRFYEPTPMVPRYHRMTIGVVKEVIRKMTELRSMKGIALELNLTVPTLCRIFRRIEYKPDSLPVVLSIDEFRGNTSKGKFQCIITDPLHRKVVDILPSRDQSSLCDYFKQFDHRENVKYFVMDMCKSYFEIAKTYFKNATIVIDRFHYVRHCTWALENVRKRVQKQLSSQERLLFKRSRKLLLSHSKYLSDEDKLAVARMLQLSTDLADAYLLKEKMYEFFSSKNSQEAKQKLKEYYLFSNACNVPEFNRCTQTFVNWEKYILSSFDCPYSNAFTEGTNNKIKVLKRVGFGYRNFNRFRNRILHCCS